MKPSLSSVLTIVHLPAARPPIRIINDSSWPFRIRYTFSATVADSIDIWLSFTEHPSCDSDLFGIWQYSVHTSNPF
ncbi:hypothetical protein BDR06DRAFT_948558 [Suillus hirtellus]|nr:hypothetical protein BDR06DRAFT_948558 [Suillus hirtellus]